jgi:hypothetical protein
MHQSGAADRLSLISMTVPFWDAGRIVEGADEMASVPVSAPTSIPWAI